MPTYLEVALLGALTLALVGAIPIAAYIFASIVVGVYRLHWRARWFGTLAAGFVGVAATGVISLLASFTAVALIDLMRRIAAL